MLKKMSQEIKELNRQIKMGWERGRDFGLFWGIIGTLLFSFIIELIQNK